MVGQISHPQEPDRSMMVDLKLILAEGWRCASVMWHSDLHTSNIFKGPNAEVKIAGKWMKGAIDFNLMSTVMMCAIKDVKVKKHLTNQI
ncbi:predicted protein [Histoplasma mississippiense (nom. inval.)]|uniref:predicted protein n=1 Tax=Ajellomyces capsulatus (strain NAm1 / WU24) TaxID=2059318 RepID=UPI000157CB97|nr:predicted protein [Histoplasma mississippiense (nom. inval.)]EDN10491.1 predicted protein [Histoplasma mississippiense (nom. inval.)]